MSEAAILREAAALMRERAQAATQAEWWWPYYVPESLGAEERGLGDWIVDSDPSLICSTNVGSERGRRDAEHIASWHPVVGLSVAEWLDAEADLDETLKKHGARGVTSESHCMKVAAAYLGRDA